MKINGLKIARLNEGFVIDPIKATINPQVNGPIDYIIFCVKLWIQKQPASSAVISLVLILQSYLCGTV